MTNGNERHGVRRDNDKLAAEYIASTIRLVRRGPPLLILVAGIVTGSTATHALATKTELQQVDSQIDSVRQMLHANIRVDSVQSDKLDLLLRLACPTIRNAELVRECRNQIGR